MRWFHNVLTRLSRLEHGEFNSMGYCLIGCFRSFFSRGLCITCAMIGWQIFLLGNGVVTVGVVCSGEVERQILLWYVRH